MGFRRDILGVAFVVTVLAGASGLNAAAPEPLVVKHLPDPDPNYVPPPAEVSGAARPAEDADQDASIDQAMETFGRAVGQAGLVIRQRVEAKCRESIPADVPAEQRYAWEARCSYQRY